MIYPEIEHVLTQMEHTASQVAQETDDKWLLPRSLHRDAARLLTLLAEGSGARAILEIGTSVGFSTVHLALAAKETGGHVTTLELLPAKQEVARANLARAGLSEFVTFQLGDAQESLKTLPGPWDLVFLDIEKELYLPAWERFRDAVRPGGLVVADNVLSHADALAGYVEAVRADARFHSATVPVGQGLEVSYRRR